MKSLVLKVVLIIIFSMNLIACERDDICIEGTTPNLIVTFHDFQRALFENNRKDVRYLSVFAKGKDTALYSNDNIDSIAIPLNIIENHTQYYFQAKPYEDRTDLELIDLSYIRAEDVFVSRSCGYKAVFEDLKIKRERVNDFPQWIDSTAVQITTITDESQTHVKIYH